MPFSKRFRFGLLFTVIFFTLVAAIPCARPVWADQPVPTLSINDVTLDESSCEGKSFVFTVTLSRLANKPVTVNYATSDGSPSGSGAGAVGGKDYVPVSGTLTFTHDTATEGPNGTYLLTITVPLGNYVVSSGSNDGREFTITLSGAANATISKAQGVGAMQNAALSCTVGTNARCSVDYCGATQACKQVDRASCSLPLAGRPGGSLASEAACNLNSASIGCATSDADGDGLSDAWERSGAIDFNCDGVITPDEMVLTNVDPVFPDGAPNPHSSADPDVKDVFVKYDWMELPDQLNNGQPIACTLNKLPSPYSILLARHSDACAFDQACLPPQGLTASCNSLADNCSCKGHTDEPSPAGLKMVIDAYAAHNIRLHLVKGHPLPHANVTYLGVAPAACTQQFSSQTFSGAQVVNFFDIKTANFNASYNGQHFDETHLFPFFHYVLFAHRHTCDSIDDCNSTFCDPAQPFFNETGRADKPGSDMIISMGGQFDRTGKYLPDVGQGGTFMHELGHNLGLDHGGPLSAGGVANDDGNQVNLNYKPNYISVMNYDFIVRGISSADPSCTSDDMVCRTTAINTRLDYSSFCPLGDVFCDSNARTFPNTLDETNGTEAAGINIGNNDIGYTWSPAQTGIPATGPVDFNDDGNTTDTWCSSGCTSTSIELNRDEGFTDVLLPFEDWPNLFYTFQCSSNFFASGAPVGLGDGAAATVVSQELTTDEIFDKHLLYPHKPVQTRVLASGAGSITLVILGAADFNVKEIELTSLSLHGAKPLFTQIEDVNQDGRPDLLVSFNPSDATLHPRATRMRLSGWLKNSQIFFGEVRFGTKSNFTMKENSTPTRNPLLP